jgi:pimeloyl-ACP methyl ester carboxylesterase
MTWLVTGPAFAALGSDLADSNATGLAFARLVPPDGRDRVTPGDNLNAAISRATSRWDGSDDNATPLRTRPNGGDDAAQPGLITVEIDNMVAFADRTFVAVAVPPGVEEIELLFFDDGLLSVVTDSSGFNPGFRLTDTETYVLVDAFVGANTTRQIALRKVAGGVTRVRLRLTGQVAVLVGTVLRVIASARAAGPRDLTWTNRLARQERAHPDVVRKHPRIEHVAPTGHEIAVFVHGTLSTCLPALADISRLSQIPLYRFEHDTMPPIAETAAQLVGELRRIGSPRVKLLGHSRGGLVATLAGAQVSGTDLVLTFGAPHCGTPLASAMDGLLAYATVALGVPAGSIIAGGLTASLFASALPRGQLPDGWADMQPQCSFIQTLPLITTQHVHAYGGVFDGHAADLGTGPLFKVDMMAALMQAANDLVVPISSSSPSHLSGETLDQVDHFSYMDDPTVRSAIEKALQPTPKR